MVYYVYCTVLRKTYFCISVLVVTASKKLIYIYIANEKNITIHYLTPLVFA